MDIFRKKLSLYYINICTNIWKISWSKAGLAHPNLGQKLKYVKPIDILLLYTPNFQTFCRHCKAFICNLLSWQVLLPWSNFSIRMGFWDLTCRHILPLYQFQIFQKCIANKQMHLHLFLLRWSNLWCSPCSPCICCGKCVWIWVWSSKFWCNFVYRHKA